MKFIKLNSNINFMKYKKIALSISAAIFAISLLLITTGNGLEYSVDFTGGTLIQIKSKNPIKIQELKTKLMLAKIKTSSIQILGDTKNNEFIIKTKNPTKTDFSNNIKNALQINDGFNFDIRRIEMVGPQISKKLREQSTLAMFYALLLITIYISGRFEKKWIASCFVSLLLISIIYLLSTFNVKISIIMTVALILTLFVLWIIDFKYATATIIALIHDIFLTIGILSIFNKEFSLIVVTALLTIIGYSLNDTIIVFDRIRENISKNKKVKNKLELIINQSINETLKRTMLTSITTLFVVIALLILGGEIIYDFALTLFIGIIIGTYSSIYVASSIFLILKKSRLDHEF